MLCSMSERKTDTMAGIDERIFGVASKDFKILGDASARNI